MSMMGRPRNKGKFANPTYNQAEKVIRKFGGEVQMARALGVSRITMYRWQYRRPYGTDGLVPSSQIEKVRAAARLHGVLLTDHDWTPERNKNIGPIVVTLDEVLS